jgi:competence protein ComEC
MPSGTTGEESATVTAQSYGRADASGHRRDGSVLAGAWLLLAAARTIGPRLSGDVHPDLVAPWSPLRLALAAACAAMLVLSTSRMRAPTALLIVVAVGTVLGAIGWADHSRVDRGVWSGTATVVGDVEWRSGTARGVLSLDGRRHWVLAGGTAGRALARAQPGERLHAEGVRIPLTGDGLVRGTSRHVVGRFEPVAITSFGAQPPALQRSATRARDLLARGASHLPPREASLFLGLAIGDDAGQPPEMVAAFRAAGLSHLTAVSGQNVAYVLALAAPLLARRAPAARTVMSIALLGWFVVVTRAEPSVVRAATMAAVGVVARSRGFEAPAARVLALTMGGLLVVDPLLSQSVGFVLSCAATTGLVVVSPLIAPLVGGPSWWRAAVSTSLGAQAAVAPVTLAAFGTAPAVALPANLLAVPVAGAVMLVGMPAAALLGALDAAAEWAGTGIGPLGAMVAWPLGTAVRWVWWVAEVAARASLPPVLDAACWAAVAATLLLRSVRLRRWPSSSSPAATNG